MDFDILTVGADDATMTLRLTTSPGEVVAFVGPNGSGKSSLLHDLFRRYGANGHIAWLPAHRAITFSAEDYGLTTTQALQYVQSYQWDYQYGRVRSGLGENHLKALVQRVVSLESGNLRNTIRAARGDLGGAAQIVAAFRSPIDEVNELFAAGRLPVRFTLSDRGDFVALRDGGELSITQLSDGERAALLLACAVVAHGDFETIIIDEPERHLNPAISHPFLKSLVGTKPALTFLLATHDTELLDALGPTRTFVVRGRRGNTGFEIEDVSDAAEEADESVRASIRGGRKKALFVEGDASSLDVQLYSTLFPAWTVHPAGGWAAVHAATVGINSSRHQHWIQAAGLIDRDGRTAEECAAMTQAQVHAIPAASVESLFCLRAVAGPMAELKDATEGPLPGRLELAERAALQALHNAKADFTARLGQWRLERAIAGAIPPVSRLRDGTADRLEFEPAMFVAEALVQIEALEAANASLDEYAQAFPIKHSAVREFLSRGLGFTNFRQYAQAVFFNLRGGTDTGIAIRAGLTARMPAALLE